MVRSLLLVAVALPLVLPSAARAEARDLLDPTARAYAGQVLPAAEIDARRGWLVFSQIDDARDALARDRRDTAAHLVARAQATLGDVRRAGAPDPTATMTRRDPDADIALPSARIDATLAQAAAALRAGDRAGADRLLADAGGALRGALVRFDDRHRPAAIATGPSRASNAYSYGGSGDGRAASGPPPTTSRFGSGGGAATMSSGPNSTPGAYGYGTTGPGTVGSAIPGYGSTGGMPGERR